MSKQRKQLCNWKLVKIPGLLEYQSVYNCCYLLLCAAICCYLLLFAAVCFYLLQFAAICCYMLLFVNICCYLLLFATICCYLLPCAAVCCFGNSFQHLGSQNDPKMVPDDSQNTPKMVPQMTSGASWDPMGCPIGFWDRFWEQFGLHFGPPGGAKIEKKLHFWLKK